MALESMVGNLQIAYRQIEPGTMQPAAAIQVERHTDESLRGIRLYVPEGPLYYIGEGREIKPDGKVMLAITPEKDNLVLRHLEDRVESENSFAQLTKEGNYSPKREEAVASINAPTTVIVDLTQVSLMGNDKEFRCLEFETSPQRYGKLNEEERKLASVYFGSMESKERADGSTKSDFEITMEKFRERCISRIRVYVVAPDYVTENTSEHKPVIARASVLDYFYDDADANANYRSVDNSGRVRGERRKAA